MKEYYCGPFWFPKFLKKCLSEDFNDLCLLHDIAYIDTVDSRKEIDKMFLEAMLDCCPEKKVRAYIYYYFVRSTGWISWYITALWKKFQ